MAPSPQPSADVTFCRTPACRSTIRIRRSGVMMWSWPGGLWCARTGNLGAVRAWLALPAPVSGTGERSPVSSCAAWPTQLAGPCLLSGGAAPAAGNPWPVR